MSASESENLLYYVCGRDIAKDFIRAIDQVFEACSEEEIEWIADKLIEVGNQ